MRKLVRIQFFILLIGTVFAWTNFSQELFAWLNQEPCTTGCSATGEVVNPFLAACFYGALFFSTAFVLNLLMFFGTRQKKVKETETSPTENKTEATQDQN